MTNEQGSIDTSRLSEISAELERAAGKLRAGSLDQEQASQLSSRCAELASQVAIELDRLARSAPEASLPGQEELL